MVDVLQRFSPGHMASMFSAILMSWLIWPVICGILGARRGAGVRGMMHGLFWGPIGIPIVLFHRRKHKCPTCGQQTLSQPIHPSPPKAIVADENMSPPLAETSAVEISPPPPTVDSSTRRPMSKHDRENLLQEACTGYSEEEKARLYSWINRE